MQKKRVFAVLLAAGILLGLAGCGNRKASAPEKKMGKEDQTTTAEVTEVLETEPETTEKITTQAAETEPETTAEETEPEITSGTLTDASGDFTYTGELKWVGDEDHGYLQVPADYTIFHDVDDQIGLVQYCKGPYNIVTLHRFTGAPVEEATQNFYASMEAEDNCDKLEVAKVQVGGYDANQIYAYYSDTAQYLVVWLIADPEDDQACYYLAMEFTQDNADLVGCSASFTPHRD